MGKHRTGKWGRDVKERGQKGFRALDSYGTLSSHPYSNGPMRQKDPIKTKQQWCYLCGEPHDYHPENGEYL